MGKGAGTDCDTRVFKRARRRGIVQLPPTPVQAWKQIEITALERFVYNEETGEYPHFVAGERLLLERDPKNDVDPDCIKVFRLDTRSQIGYVSRAGNSAIAAALDKGETVQARVTRVEGPSRSENNQLRWRAGRIWADLLLYRG